MTGDVDDADVGINLFALAPGLLRDILVQIGWAMNAAVSSALMSQLPLRNRRLAVLVATAETEFFGFSWTTG